MQVIYAGLRNGQRDQAIHDALLYKHVAEVAEEFKLSPNTVRAAAKRIEKVVIFDLTLTGGGSQCRSAGSLQIPSAKLLLEPIGPFAVLFKAWSFHAGWSQTENRRCKFWSYARSTKGQLIYDDRLTFHFRTLASNSIAQN